MPTNLASPSVAEAARRPNAGSSSRIGRLASSDTLDKGGFTPGVVLAERYRVIGLLGRGGMGEVYRADDLKLGQPVALKFLPRDLARQADLLERFYAEVRLARQVSHPNVCRVYDVGEIADQHYLSMEYVDGEDLASLLKRIGRLPPDKALDISRELCAGLSAAHDRGVLHRDLKPSNVMVDGRGRARITDFGLAVAADAQPDGELSGTPAYMAPEQLAGKGASVRSDIYALGLVLYELYTGRRAFDAATLKELRRKHAEDPPTAPSALAPGFDPAVERVILRCLEKDPAARPASAAQVARALPGGGDPLAAAMAAGETPSPEMVAAAGAQGGVAPSTVRFLLLGLAAAVALSIVLTPRANLAAFVRVEKSPELLRERAGEVLRAVGLPDKPADYAEVWDTNEKFLDWARGHGGFRSGLDRDAIEFSYRQARDPLVPNNGLAGAVPGPLATEFDPAPVEPGMAQVGLDPSGRLVKLEIVPPEHDAETAAAPATDWGPLFREAGLDMGTFSPVEPRWTPRAFAAERAAWEGPHPERPGLTMRVEAASYRGRPVSFRWLGPWSGSDREAPRLNPGFAVFSWILFVVVIASTWLAWSNVRAGRGDRRGALRLGIAVYVVVIAMWALGSHHLSGTYEVWNLISGLSNAAAMGVGIWYVYLALEPFARRRWPQMLISWTRALSGGWRDPLVGRDVLIGAAVGVAMGLVLGPARVLLPPLLHLSGPPPHGFDQEAPVNPFRATAWLLSITFDSLIRTLAFVFFLVLVRWVVRKEWIAALVVGAVFLGQYLGAPAPAVTLPLAALSIGVLLFVMVRLGLLAAFVLEACRRIYGYRIYTSDPSSWMFYAGAIALGLLLILAWWASRTALAGRPLFGDLALEEKPALT